MSEKKILIVDDDIDAVKLLKFKLENAGYNVIFAYSGKNGLELISSEKPDLVLLDILMPDISGYQVCEAIKTNPEFSHIPVIMLTGKDEGDDVELALEKKADWYVAKPYDEKYLFAKISHFISIK